MTHVVEMDGPDERPIAEPWALLAAQLDLGLGDDLGTWVYDHLGDTLTPLREQPAGPEVQWFIWTHRQDRWRFSPARTLHRTRPAARVGARPDDHRLLEIVQRASASGRLETTGPAARRPHSDAAEVIAARRAGGPPWPQYVIGFRSIPTTQPTREQPAPMS